MPLNDNKSYLDARKSKIKQETKNIRNTWSRPSCSGALALARALLSHGPMPFVLYHLSPTLATHRPHPSKPMVALRTLPSLSNPSNPPPPIRPNSWSPVPFVLRHLSPTPATHRTPSVQTHGLLCTSYSVISLPPQRHSCSVISLPPWQHSSFQAHHVSSIPVAGTDSCYLYVQRDLLARCDADSPTDPNLCFINTSRDCSIFLSGSPHG